MKKLLVCIGLLIANLLFAQWNTLPVNFQNAIRKGTRTLEGVPGEHYWQNKAQYRISATLNPENNRLQGLETITYFNHSPDTLKYLIIRLYQDVYKKGNARDWNLGEANTTDGVKIHLIKVRNDTLDLGKVMARSRYYSTNRMIPLKDPLPPNSSVELEIQWEFQVPDSIQIRMGKYKTGAYFIAYWYPQIAVYDDIDGWDRNEYYGTVEFYNDFNDYDVTITMPANYFVWGTGKLQNESEVLPADILAKLNQARTSDEVIRILTKEHWKEGISPESKSWHFMANNVTDFAFATANNYYWDATSVVVDRKTGRRVLISVLYPEGVPHYKDVLPYVQKTLKFFSLEFPGVPYPYSHTTNFCNGGAGGGMEFPMLTNDGAPKNKNSLIGLLAHEIGHTYFPFFMGINERKYAWMDEGWATFLTAKFMSTIDSTRTTLGSLSRRYGRLGGTEYDIPLRVPTSLLRFSSYRFAAYSRSSIAYAMLENALGAEKFKKGVQYYMQTWHGKHPIPTDFFGCMAKGTGEKFIIEQLRKTWFESFGYADLALKEVNVKKHKAKVTVEKRGVFPVPIRINVMYADSSKESFHWSLMEWLKSKKNVKTFKIKLKKDVLKIWLEDREIPDAVKENNRMSM